MQHNSTGAAVAYILSKATMWAILVVTGFATTYYAAFVLGRIWDWFMVPAGVPDISQRTAIGLFLVIGAVMSPIVMALTRTDGDDREDKPSEIMQAGLKVGAYAFGITVSWGVAALWNWWLV